MEREQNQSVSSDLLYQKMLKAYSQPKGPKMQTLAYMATSLWEAIIDAEEADEPFSEPFTAWAHMAMSCGTVEWFYANPDQVVTLEWPTYPLGRDNDRFHMLWDLLKRQYYAASRCRAEVESTEKAIKEFEEVHGSTTDAAQHHAEMISACGSQESSFALARDVARKWAFVGGRGVRR